MIWLQRYRVRHYFGNPIWILPVLSTLLALVAVRVVHWTDAQWGLVSLVDPAIAVTVLVALASSLFTCLVFVCTAFLGDGGLAISSVREILPLFREQRHPLRLLSHRPGGILAES